MRTLTCLSDRESYVNAPVIRSRVSPEDVAKCEERYNKSKMVHSIMRHVAETTGADLESLYQVSGASQPRLLQAAAFILGYW